ncbi:MAG: SAM-dependent methyltransferase, partial [uncultured Corynebacteriales bacterium]
ERQPGRGRGRARRPQAGQHPVSRLGGRLLRREVVDLVRRALRHLRPRAVRADRRPARPAVRAGPGARLRHRVLPAQPHAGRDRRARLGHRHQPRHGRGRPAQRPRPGSRRGRPGGRRRDDPLRRRHLRPGGGARGAAPHPGRGAGAARGGPGAQAGRPVRLRRRAHPVRRRGGPAAVPADLVGDHPGHPAAAAVRLAPAPARAGRVLPGRRAGVDRRPAHLPAGRAAPARARRRRRGRRGAHGGADRGLVRLAGADVRVRRAAGEARLGLGDVRLSGLAAAVRAGPPAGPGGAAGAVLQRPADGRPTRHV